MKVTAKEYRARARGQLGNQIFSTPWMTALLVYLIYDLIAGACTATFILVLLLSGSLAVGLKMAFLGQARNNEMKFENLFGGFTSNFVGCMILGLMKTIFLFLWSLLFVIPGIIKSYSYAMAEYICADHPDYDWKQCIDESRRMMNGYKWRLFCLDLSFIGWIIVGSLACGIGLLWVTPYMEAARAQFYLDRVQETPVEANAEAAA